MMDMQADYSYIEPLTERETEVLHLLADGASNKDIAESLVIEVSTVKWYNNQIYGKLEVKNRAQAVIRARTLGILEADTDDPLQRLQHNLPADVLAFVGRAREIDELVRQLTDEKVRLVTILGPGGMGKTRLAVEVGRHLLGYFRDGVYFVPLAAVTTAEQMLTTIAETINFKFHSDIAPRQQLLDHLQTQHLLLITDNFEHLLMHGSLVTEILQSASGVKVLATSREKLALGGEVVYTIDGLSVPIDDATELNEYDAVTLFVEAIKRSAKPAGPVDMETSARICQLLGGMPLAILLAAAWTDTLSLKEIEAEIHSGLDILASTVRDAPQRHQNIAAVFDHSWQRLSVGEQAVFMHLSVFRDGFTREAAQAVAAASIRDLQRLVHTSLIQVLPSGRYAIHELMRQYGEEKLELAGDLQRLRAQHAQYFAELIEPLGEVVFGMVSHDDLEPVNADYENIQAAWLFQAEQRNIVALRRFLDGMWLFFDSYSRSQEGIDLLEPLLAELKDDPSSDARFFCGQLLARLAWYYSEIGQLERSVVMARQSLDILLAFNATDDILLLYHCLFLSLGFMGRGDEGQVYNQKALKLIQKKPDSKWRVPIYLWAYTAKLATGGYELTTDNYEAALDWVDSLPEYNWQTWSKAQILLELGGYGQAEALLLKGINIYWLSRIHYIFWYALLVKCAVQAEDDEKAWHYIRRGLQYGDVGNYAWGAIDMLVPALQLLVAEEDYTAATELASLIAHHPASSGFAQSEITTYQETLEHNLPATDFGDAWERGKQLDLGEVITLYMER